ATHMRAMQGPRPELGSAKQQVSDLQAKEAELQRAVIAAERIANEIKENAKREAKLILDEAERLRERRVADLDGEVNRTRAELDRLIRERGLFREQFKGLLQAYTRSLEAIETSASVVRDTRTEATPELDGQGDEDERQVAEAG